jgi:hypothetical protein
MKKSYGLPKLENQQGEPFHRKCEKAKKFLRGKNKAYSAHFDEQT